MTYIARPYPKDNTVENTDIDTQPIDQDVANAMVATDTARMVRVHRKMTAAISLLTKDYEEKKAAIKAQQAAIENAMLAFLNTHNVKTANTVDGMFYWQEDITPTGADWEAFYKWVAENDAFDFLERRIKKTSIKTYMDANEGALPPGVNLYRERVIRVRKPNE